MKNQKINRKGDSVQKIKREVECWVISGESFSNYLYIYSKKYCSTAAHVPGAQGEIRMPSTRNSMSPKQTAELDEFMCIQPKGIIRRNR